MPAFTHPALTDVFTRSGLAAPDSANLNSIVEALVLSGVTYGLNRWHRLAQYGAQIAHESGDFRHDREIWGPTPAQKRYDTRTDLGNTPEQDGDGFTYRGRAGIQITGKDNFAQFTRWARAIDRSAPDFVAQPDRVLEDPWEGLVPIWYWSTRNLNLPADAGDARVITRRINGGYNGLDDRLRRVTRFSLVILGYQPGQVREFQTDFRLTADGVAGPKTNAALHTELRKATC
jgi:putative chitinase